MNTLTPIVGPQWSDASGRYVENPAERDSRFHRAQGRQLFAWRKCEHCEELYRHEAGHQCKKEQS